MWLSQKGTWKRCKFKNYFGCSYKNTLEAYTKIKYTKNEVTCKNNT